MGIRTTNSIQNFRNMRRMKTLHWGLLALLLCITLPSCSDDDENNNEQTEQEAQRGMLELLNLKMNLCLVNLKGEPTEATFGIAMSETKKDKRIYYTKDLQSAKKRYQSLFHSDTRCSEDGCTYTLANKQGTATFAEADGNKGELAVANFDVPGLKGLVTEIHFIDYNQQGENSSGSDFSKLKPGNIVHYYENDLIGKPRYAIAIGPLEESDKYYVVCTPSLQDNLDEYRPTGYIDQSMDQGPIQLIDYMNKFNRVEFSRFYSNLRSFLFDGPYTDSNMPSDYFVEFLFPEYFGSEWDWNSFYLQVKSDELVDDGSQNGVSKQVTNRYHLLLYDGCEDDDTRKSLLNLSTTVTIHNGNVTTTETELPEEYSSALPVWVTIATMYKGQYIEILQ